MSEALTSSSGTSARPLVALRQAREATGLHIAALAAALKVPVRKLEALEAGRYDELPDMAFARALASSVCRHLKMDPSLVLEQIPAVHPVVLDALPSTLNAPFRPSAATALPVLEWLRRPPVLVSLLLVTGAALIWFFPELTDRFELGTETSAPQAMSAADTSKVALAESSSTPTDAPTAPLAPTLPTPAPVTSSGIGVAATPVGDASTAPQAAATDSSSLLSIKATAQSWVEVIDGKGATQVQRMLTSGEVLDFSASPPYSVVIGRADAVQVVVRGEPFDLAPYARNSVARFKVK